MKYLFMEVIFSRIATGLPRFCRMRLFIPGIFLLFFSHAALAAVFGKVVQPFASYTFTADDNILRIRDKMDPLPLFGTNNLFDMSQRFTGGVILEKEISRQRLSANLNWTHTRFEKFDQMNNDLKNFSGNWNWLLGNRLEGNMGASYAQSLAMFLFQPGLKNIRTEQTAFINAAWRLHPGWRLHGEYTRYDLNTDSPNNRLRFLNRTEDQFESGIDYLASGKNTIGVLFRYINGSFSEPVPLLSGSFADNGYTQKEAMSKVNWIISGKSSFLVHGGWVERENASFAERDFSGFNARGIYQWQPTGKTGLAITGWRETAARQHLTASFSLNTGVSVVPFWNLTEKVRLESDLSYETRNFSRFAIFTDPELEIGRNNTVRNATVRLIYSPYRGLQLSASAYHSDLKSDSRLGGFNANGANINLHYTYGKQ